MIVSVKIIANPTNEMIGRIADFQWRGSPHRKHWMRQSAFDLDNSPSFHVVALCGDEVVGHLFGMRNSENVTYWYYGDLAVRTTFRRQGIAAEMVRTALDRIAELGGTRVCCFVEEENTASRALQEKLGFEQRPSEPFDLLDTGDELMYVRELPQTYEVLPIDEYDAFFPTVLYRWNREALHGEVVNMTDFRGMLAAHDPDEKNVLICHRGAPYAWLKLNGLDNPERAWISMLTVDPRHFREGVGWFAVRYAEEFFRSFGKTVAAVRTTADNAPAVALYQKCGYTPVGERIRMYGDGTEQTEITLEKKL